MSAALPLAGRVVLVLRPEGRAGELTELLGALGARVLHAALLAFAAPRDERAADIAVAALARYDLVVFTSATGVQAFVARARGSGVAVRAAAVGPATAAALREAGILPVLTAAVGRLEGLVAELAVLDPAPRSILAVRPDGGGGESFEALRAQGARVDEVVFYRTLGSAQAGLAVALLAREPIDAVVFSSPSTLRILLDAGAALHDVRRVAIGPRTAAALLAAGLRADAVARAPTPESIRDALLQALRPAGAV